MKKKPMNAPMNEMMPKRMHVHMRPMPEVTLPLASVEPLSHGKMKMTMKENSWLAMEFIDAPIDLTESGNNSGITIYYVEMIWKSLINV